MDNSEDAWHYEMGLHSNIPKCCVDFWSSFWHRIPKDPNYLIQFLLIRAIWDPIEALHKADPEYIPCPGCLIRGKFVDIHECSRVWAECEKHLLPLPDEATFS